MNISDLPSEDLAVYVREEDKNAYREIVKRYEKPIVKFAKLLLGNEILAHEAAVETFLHAFITLNSFNPRLNFETYLYRHAVVEIENIYKKKHHAVDIGTYPTLAEEILEEDNMEFEFSNKNLLVSLARALPHIEFKYRVTTALHYFCGKSYDEVVDILMISSIAVSTRIATARSYAKHYAKK